MKKLEHNAYLRAMKPSLRVMCWSYGFLLCGSCTFAIWRLLFNVVPITLELILHCFPYPFQSNTHQRVVHGLVACDSTMRDDVNTLMDFLQYRWQRETVISSLRMLLCFFWRVCPRDMSQRLEGVLEVADDSHPHFSTCYVLCMPRQQYKYVWSCYLSLLRVQPIIMMAKIYIPHV